VHSPTNRLQQSEYLAKYLRGHGFNAEAFHAGMQTTKKTELQEKFMENDDMIVCPLSDFPPPISLQTSL
jgi:superfamily II DNA helicase RecQ